MRHAILIIAHEKPEVLYELLSSLQHRDVDIFIHIDAKSNIDIAELNLEFPDVHILSNQIDARWGDFSIVEVELALFLSAQTHAFYDYLHLISGVDYPLHGIEYILNFCSKHEGKEFVGFARNVPVKEIEWRTGRRFLYPRDFISQSKIKRGLRMLHARLQSLPGLGRKIDREVVKGSQWVSVTGQFARYILDNEDWIRANFKDTYCPDEMVIQTLCWNSRFRDNIFDSENEFHGAMRYIPWKDGELCSFTDQDYKKMYVAEAFFGRKFTLNDIKLYRCQQFR